MKRSSVFERPGWQQLIREQGLIYNPTTTPSGETVSYWREGSYYEFSMDEVLYLEQTAADIFDMFVEAGDYLVEHPDVMRRMGIPDWAFEQIVRTWNIEDPAYGSVYGRYDIRFGGFGHPDPALRVPKLYEFNADTPTCLLESVYVQWQWLQQVKAGSDQWNSIWEKLVAAWQRNLEIITQRLGYRPTVYFAWDHSESSGEDAFNTLTLQSACDAAGYETRTINMAGIVLGDGDGRFYDEQDNHLDVVFKLYPWEYMVNEKSGRAAFDDMADYPGSNVYRTGTVWIEPPYKMLWSNKGVLAVMWQLFKDDPKKAQYLLPTWFDGDQPAGLTDYVRKPLLGREGANLEIISGGDRMLSVDGDYGDEGFVVQQLAELPVFKTADGQDMHPVLGVWMIDGEPAGLGIRESGGLVTDNQSFFVPHCIVPDLTKATRPVSKPDLPRKR